MNACGQLAGVPGAARDVQRPRRQLRRRHRRGLQRRRHVQQRRHGRLPARRHLALQRHGRACLRHAVVTPQPELCNNIDDNCNGQIDEGTLPGVGVTCGTALGTCHAGVTQCVNGKLVCSTQQHADRRGVQRPRRQLRRRRRQRQLPPDRPDLHLPGPRPGQGRRRHVQGGPPGLPRHARLRLRRLRAARPRDLRRARQRLRRRGRHEPDLPVGPRLQGRPLHDPVHARRVPLPQRLQVRGRLLRAAALRGQDLPDRPALRREHRLVRRPLRRRGLPRRRRSASTASASTATRSAAPPARCATPASARPTSARASPAAPTSTATTATASTCAPPTSARARSAASAAPA